MAEACVAKQELLEQEREAVEQASSTTKSMAGAQTSKTQSFTSGSFAHVVLLHPQKFSASCAKICIH